MQPFSCYFTIHNGATASFKRLVVTNKGGKAEITEFYGKRFAVAHDDILKLYIAVDNTTTMKKLSLC